MGFTERVKAFRMLFAEASGVRNKAALCGYVVSRARRVVGNERRGQDLIIEFSRAKLSLGIGAGELQSYIEVFLEDDYQILRMTIDPYRQTILDVGANIGVFSVAAARRFPHATIYAFEPGPAAYRRLVRNLEQNNLMNVVPVNQAVYSTCRTLQYSDVGGTTGARTTQNGGVPVQAITLDHFCQQNGIEGVGLVKIDVEGAEVDVLKGAEKTLNGTNWLVAECHSAELAAEVEVLAGRHALRKVSERRVLEGGGVLRFKRQDALP